MDDTVDPNTEMDQAFDRHIKGHIASMLALMGAENPQHHGMILSALRGTWEYAYMHGRDQQRHDLMEWTRSREREDYCRTAEKIASDIRDNESKQQGKNT